MSSFHEEIRSRARPIESLDDLQPLIQNIKDKKVVMLGESSHGTSEYYQWRKEISIELMRNHGFNFIAVEGDWPPCQKANQFIQNKEEMRSIDVLKSFDRWPTWMWSNTDVAELLDEMRILNEESSRSLGFHGLDVYSLVDSIDEAIKCLYRIDSQLAQKAAKMYSCFDPYRHDEKEYARSLFRFPQGCRDEVVNTLQEILNHKLKDTDKYSHLFNAIQNARIVKNAESYYRAMVSFEDDSWNVRDKHMMETLEMLMNHYGPDAKGIVWEHNTHIGDYRATDMVLQGQVNIGGLARETFGEDKVVLVGFGTYSGTVVASHAWDGPIQTLPVPEAKEGSVEHICHDVSSETGQPDFFMLFDDVNTQSPLTEYKGHRAIGVVYHPDFERRGNYVPTALSKRYDAFIFLDETHALVPLQVGFDPRKFPESYPFGSRV